MFARKQLLAVMTAALVLVPAFAFARSVSDIVDANAVTVSRSTFLSWSEEAIGFDKTNIDCTLPYTRYPRGLKATLCIAQSKGALDAFKDGMNYTLGQPITHGEALFILTMLTDKRDTTTDISAFTDVKTARDQQGVRNAIASGWMSPVRSTLFGVARQLTGTEALSLLNAVTGQNDSGSSSSVPSFTISLGTPAADQIPEQQLLASIWQILQKDYLRSDKIDPTEAGYKAAEAIVNSLGDPYTTFFRPVAATNFNSQLSGQLSGIGAQVEDETGAIVVVSPIAGSPADKAGLKSGDIILQADGHPLQGIGVDMAVQYIRGERGTSVHLKISRSGVISEMDVVRDTISIPEIDVKWNGDIAIVQLMQFGDTTEKQIRSILADIAKKSPHGIILDLRDNGGGLLTAADEVMSNFVPRGTVVANVKSKTDTTQETTTEDPTIDPKVKMVVLVNKGSASASEIVSGALQDLKRATIIGTQSFGKGTVQEVLSFPGGEALKVTIAEWLTPLMRELNGIGVTPDIVVDTGNPADQMNRALDMLR